MGDIVETIASPETFLDDFRNSGEYMAVDAVTERTFLAHRAGIKFIDSKSNLARKKLAKFAVAEHLSVHPEDFPDMYEEISDVVRTVYGTKTKGVIVTNLPNGAYDFAVLTKPRSCDSEYLAESSLWIG